MDFIRANRDLVIALGVTCFGLIVYFIILPWQLDIASDGSSISPALFPQIASGSIIILGIIMISVAGKKKKIFTGESLPFDWRRVINPGIGMLMIAAYLFLLGLVGFRIVTVPFLMGFMFFLGARKVWKVFIISTILTVLIYIVFDKMVNIPLPLGSLFE